MPNIFITNVCNLNCPYCFASQQIQTKQQYINEDELNNIFIFLDKIKNTERIGLIGGEPTKHPNFFQILKSIISYSKQHLISCPTVYSNGTFSDDIIDLDIFQQCNLLLNINDPNLMNKTNFNLLNTNLEYFYKQEFINKTVNIGINLYKDINDFNFIFDIANKYNFYNIRCSYAAPCKKYITSSVNKDEYYLQGKKIFLNFLEQAEQYHKNIIVDCNHIPICYFNKSEQKLIKKVCGNYDQLCSFYCDHSAIDIMPNLTAISCFGINEPINLNNFNSINDIKKYFFEYQIKPLSLKNQIGKCETCISFQILKCQGGCLAFANK